MPGMCERRGPDGSVVLLGSSCAACGQASFPRGDVCCWCGAADPAPIDLSSTGTLWGWTVVHSAPPGYHGPVPYGMGVVELPEGVRIVTRVDITDEAVLRFGLPVRLVAEAASPGPGCEPIDTWTVVPC